MKSEEYDLSIRCYYGQTDYTQHRQRLKLTEIAKWVKAYQFTHPNVKSITVKIWMEGGQGNAADE